MRSWVLALAILCSAAFPDIVSDSNLGYTITLPSNWVQLKSKPGQHYFRDSTRAFHSQISILKYEIEKASYPTPENWSQAQFIAYKLSVQTSAYPFGAVVYYDSTPAAKLGPIWAPEAFSVLYPADGDPTYCEYIRYTALGNVGYEIYAIGDSTDMTRNVDFYAGIIATLKFTTPVVSLFPARPMDRYGKETGRLFREFDLIGRELPKSLLLPAGIGASSRSQIRKTAR